MPSIEDVRELASQHPVDWDRFRENLAWLAHETVKRHRFRLWCLDEGMPDTRSPWQVAFDDRLAAELAEDAHAHEHAHEEAD